MDTMITQVDLYNYKLLLVATQTLLVLGVFITIVGAIYGFLWVDAAITSYPSDKTLSDKERFFKRARVKLAVGITLMILAGTSPTSEAEYLAEHYVKQNFYEKIVKDEGLSTLGKELKVREMILEITTKIKR